MVVISARVSAILDKYATHNGIDIIAQSPLEILNYAAKLCFGSLLLVECIVMAKMI